MSRIVVEATKKNDAINPRGKEIGMDAGRIGHYVSKLAGSLEGRRRRKPLLVHSAGFLQFPRGVDERVPNIICCATQIRRRSDG